MASTSGGMLKRFFEYQAQSLPIQSALLIALPVYVAAFSRWCDKQYAFMFGHVLMGDLRIPVLLVVTLILLEAYAITVIAWRKVVDLRLFTFTTLLIAGYGILSTTDLSPRDPIRIMFFTTWLIAPPYLAMCTRQGSKMRSLIASIVVFPTLLRAHSSRMDLDVLTKLALVTPALTFVAYDYAKLLLREKDRSKMLKHVSCTVIFAGALTNAAGLIFYPDGRDLEPIVSFGGFVLANVGCIVFSAIFLNKKKENTRMNGSTRLIISISGITILLIFIIVSLLSTYSWLKWSRQFVFVLVAGITIHFFCLAYFHRFIREQIPNWLNFLALLCFTLAMSFAAVSLRFARDLNEEEDTPYKAARADQTYQRQMQYYNESLGFPAVDGFPFNDESAGSMIITALECGLIVIYLMAATMHKDNEQHPAAVEFANAAEAEALLRATVAAAAVIAAASAAEPCCASEPYSEDEEYEAPRHKTLEEPD